MNLTISILDIKEDEFVRSIYNLEEAGISSFHIDVMDGKFTESKNNIDEMYSRLSVLNQVSIMKKDVHLMTYDLKRNIDLFAFLEPDTITVHYEAIIKEYNLEKETKEKQVEKIIEIIRYIQKKGIKAGISINPATDEKNIIVSNIRTDTLGNNYIYYVSVFDSYYTNGLIKNFNDSMLHLKIWNNREGRYMTIAENEGLEEFKDINSFEELWEYMNKRNDEGVIYINELDIIGYDRTGQDAKFIYDYGNGEIKELSINRISLVNLFGLLKEEYRE